MFFIDFHQALDIGGDVILGEQFIQGVDAVFNFADTVFNAFNLILAFAFLRLFFLLAQVIIFSGRFCRSIAGLGLRAD